MSRILGGAILVMIASVGCGKSAAQSANDPALPVAPVTEITVVGCVQPADGTATNAAGANDTKYMLTRTKSPDGSSNAATGTGGGSARSQPTSSTYRLDGNDATLTPQVDHQVEIVAVLDDPDPAPAGKAGTVPKLKIETIKMVTMPCPK
jgi:hypothetical protein